MLCRLCGDSIEESIKTCGNCGISIEESDILPAWISLDPPRRQNVARFLEKHPPPPTRFHLQPSECKCIGKEEINYSKLNDLGNTRFFLWVSERDKTLYVRQYNHEPGSNCLTFNGLVQDAGKLMPGELLTIGEYHWIFHAYADGQGYGLEPGNNVVGSSLIVKDLRVRDRLKIVLLEISAGEFVGIVGPTGSGKSTLIKEIIESRFGSGEVVIDGESRDKILDRASLKIAYVPQEDVLFDDLTIEQQVRDYAQIAKERVDDEVIEESLRVVGLRDLSNRFPSQLSGGQKRRARIAAAFARQTGFMLLDEPDSGLDPDTAIEIRRILRTFSLLGATVVAITHHRHSQGLFDRVIEMRKGEVFSDTKHGPDTDKRQQIPETIPSLKRQQIPETIPSLLCQSWQIIKREFLELWQRNLFGSLPQWPIELLLLPVLFGTAIAFSLPHQASLLQPNLASFLCVLCVVWLAASYSHLSLSINAKRYAFEFVQGQRPYALVAAKSVSGALVSWIQTTFFYITFWASRYKLLGAPMFFGTAANQGDEGAILIGENYWSRVDCHYLKVYFTLLIVSLTASQMGLLISALCKHRTLLAASLLPLAMIAQILFSPFVVRANRSDRSLEVVFEGYWYPRSCQGINDCPSISLRYTSQYGFVCTDCEEVLDFSKSSQTKDSLRGQRLNVQDIRTRLDANREVPNRTATIASYLTITRFSDLALRQVVDQPQTEDHAKKYAYTWLRIEGIAVLLLYSLTFLAATACLMSGVKWRRFRRSPRANS